MDLDTFSVNAHELVKAFAEMERRNEWLEARVRVLEAASPDIVTPQPPKLAVFPHLDAINWDSLRVGPFKYLHFIVDGQEYRRAVNIWHMPDWYAIAHHRVIDVTAPIPIALVQSGDDSYENDWDDMAKLVREYKGGLRYPLHTWGLHETGDKLRAVYLETHDEPYPVNPPNRPIPVTPAG